MTPSRVRAEFLRIASLPEEQIDLITAALLIAKEEYPDLDVGEYAGRVDRLAREARPRIERAQGNPFAVIDALNTFLFAEQGFRGNLEEYFDPRNSFLNEVLDRRRGIPITLSLLYMEVARRAGFPIQGVSFPGHFLVRHAADGREILIDPFHAGEILMPDDCRRRLKRAFGEKVPLEQRFFSTAGSRQILSRMLTNLKGIYVTSGDFERVVGALDRLVALAPGDPDHLLDRGMALAKLHRFASAAADLKACLSLAPAAADRPVVRRQIVALRRLTAFMN